MIKLKAFSALLAVPLTAFIVVSVFGSNTYATTYSSDLQITDKLYSTDINGNDHESVEVTNIWSYPFAKTENIATNVVDNNCYDTTTEVWDDRAESFTKARQNGYYAVVQESGKSNNPYSWITVFWSETKIDAKIQYSEPNYGLWQLIPYSGTLYQTKIQRCGKKITAVGFDTIGSVNVSTDPNNTFQSTFKLYLSTFPIEYPQDYTGSPAPSTALPSDTQQPPTSDEQVCTTTNVFDNLACNISNMSAKIVNSLSWFFVPDMDDLATQFNNFINLMTDKLGFVAQPFTIIPELFNQVHNLKSCAFTAFGNNVDFCESIKNLPLYTQMVTIMRTGAVIGVLSMLRSKFFEVTQP